jgi:hypothetical protein
MGCTVLEFDPQLVDGRLKLQIGRTELRQDSAGPRLILICLTGHNGLGPNPLIQ